VYVFVKEIWRSLPNENYPIRQLLRSFTRFRANRVRQHRLWGRSRKGFARLRRGAEFRTHKLRMRREAPADARGKQHAPYRGAIRTVWKGLAATTTACQMPSYLARVRRLCSAQV
jgi:hypothetical protein